MTWADRILWALSLSLSGTAAYVFATPAADTVPPVVQASAIQSAEAAVDLDLDMARLLAVRTMQDAEQVLATARAKPAGGAAP